MPPALNVKSPVDVQFRAVVPEITTVPPETVVVPPVTVNPPAKTGVPLNVGLPGMVPENGCQKKWKHVPLVEGSSQTTEPTGGAAAGS
jgi:hypothetical protein